LRASPPQLHVPQAIAGRESWWARLLSYFVMGVERLIVQVSAFVVIYSALTGRSFCTASREMNDLLRRNMLERFVIGASSEAGWRRSPGG